MIFTLQNNRLFFYIRVIPNASKNALGEILTLDDKRQVLKIYVKAPAVDGKANKAVIDFLAKSVGIKKSNIEIIKGTAQKYKTIEIKGDSKELLNIQNIIKHNVT